MSGNGCKPISAEPITAEKRESLEIGKRKSQKLQALVADSHPLEPQLLETPVLSRKNHQPTTNISAPIRRNQVKVRKPGLPFQGHAPNVREPPDHDLRRHRVAVSNEDVGPWPPLGVVPILADKRDRAPVLAGLHQSQNSLQNLVWERRGHPGRLARVTDVLLSLRIHSVIWSSRNQTPKLQKAKEKLWEFETTPNTIQ